MNGRHFEFEWDDAKAAANERKHGVSFELAATTFHDPRILTTADLEHSVSEERWFGVGCSSAGTILSVVFLWSDAETTRIRIISARRATQRETRSYEEGL